MKNAEKFMAFAKRMQESDDCDFSEIGDDLVNFAEQWINERDDLLQVIYKNAESAKGDL